MADQDEFAGFVRASAPRLLWIARLLCNGDRAAAKDLALVETFRRWSRIDRPDARFEHRRRWMNALTVEAGLPARRVGAGDRPRDAYRMTRRATLGVMAPGGSEDPQHFYLQGLQEDSAALRETAELGRQEAARVREEAAAMRAQAAERRKAAAEAVLRVAEQRQLAAMLWIRRTAQHDGAERAIAADQRDQQADQREAIADQRDQQADERERLADLRDRESATREGTPLRPQYPAPTGLTATSSRDNTRQGGHRRRRPTYY